MTKQIAFHFETERVPHLIQKVVQHSLAGPLPTAGSLSPDTQVPWSDLLTCPIFIADPAQERVEALPFKPEEWAEPLPLAPPYPLFMVSGRAAMTKQTMIAGGRLWQPHQPADAVNLVKAGEYMQADGWAEVAAIVNVIDLHDDEQVWSPRAYDHILTDPAYSKLRWIMQVRSFLFWSPEVTQAVALAHMPDYKRGRMLRQGMPPVTMSIVVGEGIASILIDEDGLKLDPWGMTALHAIGGQIDCRWPWQGGHWAPLFKTSTEPMDIQRARPLTVYTMEALCNRAPVEQHTSKVTRQQRRAAARAGEPEPVPTVIFKLLDVEPTRTVRPSVATGDGAKRRAHQVMGHFRRYQSGKVVWVAPHWRGLGWLKEKGAILKDYRLKHSKGKS